MKTTQLLVLLGASIASAARCKPSFPATLPSATASVGPVLPPPSSSSSAVIETESASAIRSSSTFGSSSSLSASLSASSASATVSATSASLTSAVSSASSVASASAVSSVSSAASSASSVASSASATSSSAATPSASCGVTNLFGSAADMATNGADWNPQGSAAYYSDDCEDTVGQCLEVEGTSATANTFAFGYFIPTTPGTAYTLTFDFAVLSGSLSSPVTCTISGGSVVNESPSLTSGAGVFAVSTMEFTGAAESTTTNFFCSGSSTTAFEVAFNNFFYTNAC